LIDVKAVTLASGHSATAQPKEIRMTPFLALVAAGYAVFVTALLVVWVQDALYEAKLKKQASR
jgi:hypothetical protein